MKIALINCVVLPEHDPDEAPLLGALARAGHRAQTLAWDDPDGDPGAFDACVLRATWNYHREPGRFRDWLHRAAGRTRLLNPIECVLWNMHKRYLCDLEQRRIPIVPTAWADRGTRSDLSALCARRGWDRVVIKPAVSGGSRETRLFDMGRDAAGAGAFLEASSAREDTMIQRYMPSVESGGEISIVCIGGEVSHGVVKRARFAGEDESVKGIELGEAHRRFARAVLADCPYKAVYARVDVMLGAAGEIMLSELELIEPSLFFDLAPGSADRMADAIARACAD